MSRIEYLRPTSMDEAIEMLQRGIPLGGGTELTPRRNELDAVIDLSALGLDEVRISQSSITLGGTTTIQSLVEEVDLPESLRHVCRLESGWNIRNMATIGGVIETSDGRSPLLTTLLGLGTVIHFEPNSQQVDLDDYLVIRHQPRIIQKIEFSVPQFLLYEQVARSPRDLPIVCAALVHHAGDESRTFISLGGYGQRPKRMEVMETDIEATVKLAEGAFKGSDDPWASGEYRSNVAGILVERLLQVGRS